MKLIQPYSLIIHHRDKKIVFGVPWSQFFWLYSKHKNLCVNSNIFLHGVYKFKYFTVQFWVSFQSVQPESTIFIHEYVIIAFKTYIYLYVGNTVFFIYKPLSQPVRKK